jgi:hypothetical protein
VQNWDSCRGDGRFVVDEECRCTVEIDEARVSLDEVESVAYIGCPGRDRYIHNVPRFGLLTVEVKTYTCFDYIDICMYK